MRDSEKGQGVLVIEKILFEDRSLGTVLCETLGRGFTPDGLGLETIIFDKIIEGDYVPPREMMYIKDIEPDNYLVAETDNETYVLARYKRELPIL